MGNLIFKSFNCQIENKIKLAIQLITRNIPNGYWQSKKSSKIKRKKKRIMFSLLNLNVIWLITYHINNDFGEFLFVSGLFFWLFLFLFWKKCVKFWDMSVLNVIVIDLADWFGFGLVFNVSRPNLDWMFLFYFLVIWRAYCLHWVSCVSHFLQMLFFRFLVSVQYFWMFGELEWFLFGLYTIYRT